MRYHYACEKLGSAIETLATSPGDVRARLLDAFLIFHTMNTDDFPKEFQSDWKWIIKEMTKNGHRETSNGRFLIGSGENTMSKIKNKTGVKIAKRIYSINQKLDCDL